MRNRSGLGQAKTKRRRGNKIDELHLGFLARNRRVNITSVLLPRIECIKVDYVFCIDI